jgi:acetyl-CoA acetyltransferase
MPKIDPDTLPEEALERMGVSREQFREIAARMEERDKRTPAAGAMAPDFELECLSPEGEPTGRSVRLSDHLGRPTALIFGSYT